MATENHSGTRDLLRRADCRYAALLISFCLSLAVDAPDFTEDKVRDIGNDPALPPNLTSLAPAPSLHRAWCKSVQYFFFVEFCWHINKHTSSLVEMKYTQTKP